MNKKESIIEIVKLFHKKEIGLMKSNYFISGGMNEKDISLPVETVAFRNCGILNIDSGNFETGEQYFILETNIKLLKEKIIKLSEFKNIDHLIDKFKPLVRDKRISKILES